MKRRTFGLMIVVAAILAGGAWAAEEKSGDEKKPPKRQDRKARRWADAKVFRFVGQRRGSAWSRPVMQVALRPPAGGAQIVAVVPNRDNKGKKYDPVPAIADVVKQLKGGDLVEARTDKFMGKILLRSLRAYEAEEGENEPGTFILGKLEEVVVKGQPYTILWLSKWKITQKVLLPNVRNDEGKLVPDAAMAEKIRSLGEGAVAEVKVVKAGGRLTVREIYGYVPAAEGEFVRFVAESGDDGVQAGVVVKIDGEEKTLPVVRVKRSGKMVPAPKVVAAARRLKPGRTVTCKMRKDGEATFVTMIKAVRKKPSAGKE